MLILCIDIKKKKAITFYEGFDFKFFTAHCDGRNRDLYMQHIVGQFGRGNLFGNKSRKLISNRDSWNQRLRACLCGGGFFGIVKNAEKFQKNFL